MLAIIILEYIQNIFSVPYILNIIIFMYLIFSFQYNYIIRAVSCGVYSCVYYLLVTCFYSYLEDVLENFICNINVHVQCIIKYVFVYVSVHLFMFALKHIPNLKIIYMWLEHVEERYM